MICEGSGFPEGDSANAPDFITGRFHDRTYAKIIIILENDTTNQTVRHGIILVLHKYSRFFS